MERRSVVVPATSNEYLMLQLKYLLCISGLTPLQYFRTNLPSHGSALAPAQICFTYQSDSPGSTPKQLYVVLYSRYVDDEVRCYWAGPTPTTRESASVMHSIERNMTRRLDRRGNLNLITLVELWVRIIISIKAKIKQLSTDTNAPAQPQPQQPTNTLA
jgi:hypothetical protein